MRGMPPPVVGNVCRTSGKTPPAVLMTVPATADPDNHARPDQGRGGHATPHAALRPWLKRGSGGNSVAAGAGRACATLWSIFSGDVHGQPVGPSVQRCETSARGLLHRGVGGKGRKAGRMGAAGGGLRNAVQHRARGCFTGDEGRDRRGGVPQGGGMGRGCGGGHGGGAGAVDRIISLS